MVRRPSVRSARAASVSDARREAEADLDHRLDEAIEESFPASDPIAVDPLPAPGRRKARQPRR